MTVIHIAGWPVRVGNQCRQLCAWCGHALTDVNLEHIAVHPPPEPGEPVLAAWEAGALVAVDGTGGSWIVRHADGDDLPRGCCASPPPALRLLKPEEPA